MHNQSIRRETYKIRIITACVAALAGLAGCASNQSGIGAASRVPNAASTGRPAQCGNGLIEAGESCESCPVDCPTLRCPESADEVTFDVTFTVPTGDLATSVTTLIGYDGRLLRFPYSGLTADTQKRVQNRLKGAATYANALGSAIRVVQTKNDGLASGWIYSVVLDRCKDAPAATAEAVTCRVEGCAGKFGLIDGCACSIVPSRGPNVSELRSKQD